MSDKTSILKASFYLVGETSSFLIDEDTSIGRSNCDINIEDEKISASHCKIEIRGRDFLIEDVGSKNGVFINQLKIFPNKPYKISFGDKIKIGNTNFTVSQSKFLPLETGPEVVSKKFKLIDVSDKWKSLYVFAILVFLGIFIYHLSFDYQKLPEELSFLNSLYRTEVLKAGFKEIFLVILASIIHVGLISHVFKNVFGRLALTLPYLIFLFSISHFRYGPAWPFKQYSDNRELVFKDREDIAEINYLINLHSADTNITEAYLELENLVSSDNKIILENDLKKIKETIQAKEGLILASENKQKPKK